MFDKCSIVQPIHLLFLVFYSNNIIIYQMEICHRLLTYSMYKDWRKAPRRLIFFYLGGALHRLFFIKGGCLWKTN